MTTNKPEVVAVVKNDSPLPGCTDFMKYEPWMADGLSDGWEKLMTVAQHNAIVAARAADKARIAELEVALDGLLAIVSDSTGVVGYHLNGNIAEWDDFDEVSAAEAALAHQKREGWVSEIDCRRLLAGFAMDCNFGGIDYAADNLLKGMKLVARTATHQKREDV